MREITKQRLHLCWKLPLLVVLSPVIILVTGFCMWLEITQSEIEDAERWGKLVDDQADGKSPRRDAGDPNVVDG